MIDKSDTFKQKLYECNKHIEKINDAKGYLKDIMPLSIEKYQTLSKIESSFIDQLIFRFSKLQDSIGESIFRGILILSQENVKKMTFLDILNRLEELEIIDKNRWLKLREIRNEIAHEYSFNQKEVIDNINLVYNEINTLKNIYKNICKFIEERFNIQECK